jgi:ABC-2 type transport system permease protein
MKAFLNLYLAGLWEFTRSRMTLFWTVAFPIFLILLFGVIFSGGGDTRFRVGVVVEDQGDIGGQLAQVFKSVSVLEINEGDFEEELAALRRGDRRAVIVLPAGLSENTAVRQPSAIQVYYDPAQQQASQIVLGITRQVLQAAERKITQTPVLLTVNEQTVQAQNLRGIDFFVPGILAMALLQLGLFGTAQPIVQLREQGVLRRLNVTPLRRSTILSSQVALRLTIGLVQVVVIVAIAVGVFKVPLSGNWPQLLVFVVLGALVFVALGYVIAAFVGNQESAGAIASILSFPMIYLSGLFFPIETLPSFLQRLALLFPVTYLGDALRQTMVGANPLNSLAVNGAVLLAWLVVSLALAVRFFKWDNSA